MYACTGAPVHQHTISMPKILTPEEHILKVHKNSVSSVFAHADHIRQIFYLFEDLLTPKEFKELAIRWQILQMLAKGIPQRKIMETLKVSNSKVTRGARVLANRHAEIWNFLTRYKS